MLSQEVGMMQGSNKEDGIMRDGDKEDGIIEATMGRTGR